MGAGLRICFLDILKKANLCWSVSGAGQAYTQHFQTLEGHGVEHFRSNWCLLRPWVGNQSWATGVGRAAESLEFDSGSDCEWVKYSLMKFHILSWSWTVQLPTFWVNVPPPRNWFCWRGCHMSSEWPTGRADGWPCGTNADHQQRLDQPVYLMLVI